MVIPDGPYDDPANAYVPNTDDPDAADAMAEDEMLHEFDEKQKKVMVCKECGTRMFDFSSVTDSGFQHCGTCGLEVRLISKEEYDREQQRKHQ